jgi:hypothetical protein
MAYAAEGLSARDWLWSSSGTLSQTVTGLVIVLLLAPLATGQTRLFSYDGEMDGLGYGFGLAALGDIDQDGTEDYGVSAPFISPRMDVYSGRSGVRIYSLSGSSGGCFGMSQTSLGDITGDGVPDFAVGAPRESTSQASTAGTVYVYDGSDASLLLFLEGDISGGRFGLSIANAGDVDGDGINDLIVGSPWDNTIDFEQGSVDVYSGAGGALIHHIDGDTSYGWFGWDVASAGDLNGDGRSEFMAGAPRRWYGGASVTAGEVWVLDGATGGIFRTYVGNHGNDFFGTSIAWLPDVDGDGIPEHVIGQPRFTDGTFEKGRLVVYSGDSGGLMSATIGLENSRYGTSVASIGDFDGDGESDLLVGACYCQNTGPSWAGNGYATILTPSTGAVLGQVSGSSGAAFSYTVAGLEDINGDSVPDFVVGNHWDFTTGPKAGSGFVYSGKTLNLTMDEYQVSRSAGGTQQLSIDLSLGFAGEIYVVVGSLSGYAPGFTVDNIAIPINFDWYTSLSLTFANSLWFVNSIDFLDAFGDASPSLSFSANLLPLSAVGMLFDHTAVIVQGSTVVAATNHVPLTIMP